LLPRSRKRGGDGSLIGNVCTESETFGTKLSYLGSDPFGVIRQPVDHGDISTFPGER
jgi:hypothetical protein